jgi:hypothetical protein
MATLTSVLEISRSAIAHHGDMTVMIERTDDMNGQMMGYWYDIQRPGRRDHNFYFDYEIVDPLLDLQDFGIDTDVLQWEATDQDIDVTGCTCDVCKDFCLSYGFIPRGLPWYEALSYRALFLWRGICWQVRLCRIRFNDWKLRHFPLKINSKSAKLEQLQALCEEIGYKLVAVPGEDEFFIWADDESVSYSRNHAGINEAYKDVSHDAEIIRARKEQA